MSRRHDRVPTGYWAPAQSYIFATVTLVIGITIGLLLRGSGFNAPSNATAAPVGGYLSSPTSSSTYAPSFDSSTVEPLLHQLQSRPTDPALLAQIGNTYYDGHEYTKAVEYYQRSLKIRPGDVNVRTDMGTALWYGGDTDLALKQFEESLTYQPHHAQTLFNMGIVKWQGKHDSKGAFQVWERLLASNPDYSDRQKVLDLMQQLRSTSGS